MTYLFNDPSAFAEEMVAGFVSANRRYVRAVPGGVVRSARPRSGTVAVVIGGGSGHYPAFGGLVGPGLAHGAAMGNLFASPSSQQIHSVASAAECGGGVLFTYGNYAGDVLNFSVAERRLREEGIDCRTVVVSDDVASAPPTEKNNRRGIAGDLAVFKAAGAAADQGYDLDEVARVAQTANERTRSFGVAFSGCTLPGADAPLFAVPTGRMAVGLGIHGEPGIDEIALPTADGLANLFVSTLLSELPDGIDGAAGQRVAVVLNGLGSIKYEELFVTYRSVAALLEGAGVEIVEPEVGEFCTSFDMAGTSLTLCWLDDELERLWRAPADTPAYRKGSVAPREMGEAIDDASSTRAQSTAGVVEASRASRTVAASIAQAIDLVALTVDAHVDELGRIDAIAGDGDHGIGMQRGARAAAAAAHGALVAGAGAGTLLVRAGDAWADRAGGTSGALWGAALVAAGTTLGDHDAPSSTSAVVAVARALDAILALGGAQTGDKTMVDAIAPFSEILREQVTAGSSLARAWGAAATAAAEAAAATSEMLPRRGRARPHAQRSRGTPDAGAHSFALIVAALDEIFDEEDST